MKLCKDCGKNPCLKMKVKRNSEYFPRCIMCHRKHNKLRARQLRIVVKRARLAHNAELEKTGWRVCSNCFKKKVLSEYSRRYGMLGGKLHKMCDTCLSKSLLNNRSYMSEFTPGFWRVRAYACNCTYRNRLKRLTGRVHDLSSIQHTVKPQQLIKLYQKQGGKCHYCRVKLTTDNLTSDHAQSISNNGKHHIRNIRLSCSDCNQLKGSRNENEFRIFLREYASRLAQVLDLRDKEPAKLTQ